MAGGSKCYEEKGGIEQRERDRKPGTALGGVCQTKAIVQRAKGQEGRHSVPGRVWRLVWLE